MSTRHYPSIDYYIRSAWLAISKMYNEEAAKHGSTMVHGFTLLSIDPNNGTPSTALGPRMGIEPTSLSRTLNNLESYGLIERIPNPMDGRSIIVKLTQLGYEKREMTKAFVLSFHQKITDAIAPEHMQTFLEVIQKIQEITDDIRCPKI